MFLYVKTFLKSYVISGPDYIRQKYNEPIEVKEVPVEKKEKSPTGSPHFYRKGTTPDQSPSSSPVPSPTPSPIAVKNTIFSRKSPAAVAPPTVTAGKQRVGSFDQLVILMIQLTVSKLTWYMSWSFYNTDVHPPKFTHIQHIFKLDNKLWILQKQCNQQCLHYLTQKAGKLSIKYGIVPSSSVYCYFALFRDIINSYNRS